jgi:hypothetical protein
MKWLVLSLALAACGYYTSTEDDTVPQDAALSFQECEDAFQMAISRQCSVPTDCVLLAHNDCCGETEIGVSKADLAAAMTAQQEFNTCSAAACGGRGCGRQTTSEDGMIPGDGQMIVATCVANRCTSTVQ